MRMRVLIVENDGIISSHLARLLGKMGHEVVDIAVSGEDAVGMIEACRPDVVLMDIVLEGGMDGIDAAGIVAGRFDIPVIFITAHSEGSLVSRAMSVHPYGYILKPFREGEIRIVLEMGVDRHRLGAALRQSEEKYRSLVSNSPDIVYSLDAAGRVTAINKDDVFFRTFGISKSEVVGMPFADLLHPDDRDSVIESFVGAVRERREFTRGLEFRLLGPNGAARWYELHSHSAFDESGVFRGEDGVLRDITEKKKLQLELERAAHFDAMTGVYNRRTGMILLEKQVQQAARDGRDLTVCFVDIDGLKMVNDTHGHHEGDSLIVAVAQALVMSVRASDIISRIGGDEFLVVLPGCTRSQAQACFSSRLSAGLARSAESTRRPYALSVSIGFAQREGKSMTVDKLVEIADREMYEDKKRKKGVSSR